MRLDAVFEGSGMKSIGLVGALSVVEKKGFTWHRLAGTSSGAIVATLLAAGYNADEIKTIIMDTSFQSLLKKTWVQRLPLGSQIRIFFKNGMYPGDLVVQWMEHLLLQKGIRTFGDLEEGKLRIIASDISRGKLLILPDDAKDYGWKPEEFPISLAVRMSTSIPFFFDPVIFITNHDPLQMYYIVDGAILSNFPVWLFDRDHGGNPEWPTFGFNIVGKNEGQPYQVKGPFSMLNALFLTMLEARDQRYVEDLSSLRTIFIPDKGVRTTEFHLSVEKKEELFQSGVQSAEKFFKNWSFQTYVTSYKKALKKNT